MTKTTNYQLNQWAKSDRIMMDDFNADNQKIDAALKAVADGGAKLAVGTYNGNDETSQTITLPFTPKAVLICPLENSMQEKYGDNFYLYGGLIAPGASLYQDARHGSMQTVYNTIVAAEVSGQGFTVYANVNGVGYSNLKYFNYMNSHYCSFRYLAIG